MKPKNSQNCIWLAGATLKLTAAISANANVVVHGLNHDLTTPLTNRDIFPGNRVDDGQWLFGSANSYRSVFAFKDVSGVNVNNAIGTPVTSAFQYYINVGSDSLGSAFSFNGAPNTVAGARGYIAWNLSDGIEGYLRVEALDGPAIDRQLHATGFVFDAMNPYTRPDLDEAREAGFDPAGAINTLTNDVEYTGPINAPEPSSFLLLAAGAGGLVLRRRREA